MGKPSQKRSAIEREATEEKQTAAGGAATKKQRQEEAVAIDEDMLAELLGGAGDDETALERFAGEFIYKAMTRDGEEEGVAAGVIGSVLEWNIGDEEDEDDEEMEQNEMVRATRDSDLAEGLGQAIFFAHNLLTTNNPLVDPAASEEDRARAMDEIEGIAKSPSQSAFHMAAYAQFSYYVNKVAELVQEFTKEPKKVYEAIVSMLADFGKQELTEEEGEGEALSSGLLSIVSALVRAQLMLTEFAVQQSKGACWSQAIELLGNEVISKVDLEAGVLPTSVLKQTRTAVKIFALNTRAKAHAQAYSFLESGETTVSAKKDTGAALEDVTTAIALDGSFAFSYEVRAQLLQRQGESTSKVLEDLDKAVQFNTTNNHSLVMRAALHEKNKDYKRAREDISAAVEFGATSTEPKDPELLVKRAIICWHDSKDLKSTLRDLSDAVDQLQDGDLIESVSEAVKELFKDAPKQYGQLANALILQKSDVDGAIAILDNCIAELKDNKEALSQAHLIRGVCRLLKTAEGETPDLGDLDKAIAADPLNLSAYVEKANALYAETKVGDDKKALETLTAGVQQIEKNKLTEGNDVVQIYGARSSIYNHMDKIDEALEDMHKANTAAHEKDDNVLYRIAEMSMAKDKYDTALEYLNKAIAINKTIPEYWATRAEVHRKLGNEEAAKKDEKRAEEVASADDDEDGDMMFDMGDSDDEEEDDDDDQ